MMKNVSQNQFSKRLNSLADISNALSHPARLAILEQLSLHGNCVCGSIVESLPFSQSTVSQHLKELKNAGLITGQTKGVRVCYCLNEKKIAEASKYLSAFFDRLLLNNTNCCAKIT
jgi:ArsR family transcriptional regulator, arsenate/arsenite/antimonite-responsive transcriptional repressor